MCASSRFGPRRRFSTRCGGLFLFVPDLVRLELEKLARAAQLPGSRMIPAAHALRCALALKLWSIERKSHVMAFVTDPGLALFCGLNVDPQEELPVRVLLARRSRAHHRAAGRLAPRG